MNYPELDINLTDDETAIKDMEQRFGREVVRPAGIRLDRLADPADMIAPDSELWDVHRAYRELGLHKLRFPAEVGGMGGQTSLLSGILIISAFVSAVNALAQSLSSGSSDMAA